MRQKFKTAICLLAVVVTSSVMTGRCAAQVSAVPQGGDATQAAAPQAVNPAGLLDPDKATETAPDEFYALVKTSKGDFVVHVKRAWAPNGADRFYNLIRVGYYNSDVAFFRTIQGFMNQFGIHGDPAVSAKWSDSNIPDDPSIGKSNLPYTMSFAQTQAPNSRSVQIFINTGNNAGLDKPQGRTGTGTPFIPFGEVVEGRDVVDKIFITRENPRGQNVQGKYKAYGDAYIKDTYPNVDVIRSITEVQLKAQGK